MADFTLKQNDTRPRLQRYITQTVNGATSPVDLTSASQVKLNARLTSAAAVVFTGVATMTTVSSAYLTYTFTAGQTATNGIYDAEWEITYSDGGIETVPNDGYFSIEIVDDLG